MPKLLQNLTIKEVSSVSRGAGKGVKVMLMKMRDGTPTLNETLDKAIEKMFEVSTEHGVPPENLAKARRALSASIAEVEKNVAAEDQQTAIEKSLSQCVDYLTGLVPIEKATAFLAAVSAFSPKESAMKPEEIAKMIADAVKLAVDPLQKSLNDSAAIIAKQGETITLQAMSKEHQEYAAQIAETDTELRKNFFTAADEAAREVIVKAFPPKKAKKPPVDEEDGDNLSKAVAKALETSPVIKSLRDENTELKKQLGHTTDAAAIAAFAKKATDLGLPAPHGEVMRKAYAGDAAAQTAHEQMLKGIANQARTGEIFKEFGNGGGDSAGATAYEVVKAKADELRKTNPKLSPQQARAKIFEQEPELFQKHQQEERVARSRAA